MSIYIQDGNKITVPKGSTIRYAVEADGYKTKRNQIIADETKTIPVILEVSTDYTFTIKTLPENAIVEFEVINSDGIYSYTDSIETTYEIS